MTATAQRSRPRPARGRQWLFRVAALLLGLSVFALAEGVCLLFGWGRPTDYDDPFVGFSHVHPLFVLDESGEAYQIPKSRLGFFAAESFPATKGESTFRVFCLGGSTVQGRPFSKETAFTTWLELGLDAGDPGRDWEVVNCGGISYASYRLVPILKECLSHEPDLFVICTGHNEFLEERTYEHIKHAPPLLAVPQRGLSRLRIYTLLRSAWLGFSRGSHGGNSSDAESASATRLKEKPDAWLDYKGGIKAYHRDDEWKAGVIAHYEYNLRRMIRIARNAGVPVLLVRPPSNLCDSPPFKSERRDGLTDAELDRWTSLVEEARSHYRTDLRKSVELLRGALEIDDRFAALYFELGKCYETLGRHDDARAAFLQARELDICPLRMLAPMEEALARVARETNTPLVDAHELLERGSPGGTLGLDRLVDHIHPSPAGHQEIANALADEMARQGWLEPAADWRAQRDAAYRRHFDSLDEMYFARGQRTLEALRAWTQGNADGPPIELRLGRRARTDQTARRKGSAR